MLEAENKFDHTEINREKETGEKPKFSFNTAAGKSSGSAVPKKGKLNHWKLATVVLAVLLVIIVFTVDSNPDGVEGSLSGGEAAAKTLSFVNTNLLQGQAVAQLDSVGEAQSGVYNVKLNVNGQLVDGYVTADGKYFFPQAINLDEPRAAAPAAPAAPSVPKADKPVVDLFVMSHCPFGTQAEKGILPVIENLGDTVDFQVKFVNYAMHGEKEVLEQMNQVCIEKEQNEKFFTYLKCFLGSGEGETCLAQAKIDTTKLKTCVEALDKEFKITELLADQTKWSGGRFPQFLVYDAENQQYGVQGSPTLVVNGQSVSSGRSPAEYLAVLCAAFNEEPEECQAQLSSQSFSPGFGYEAVGAATTANCVS